MCSTTIRFQDQAPRTSSCHLKILETVSGPILQSPVLVLFIRISFLTPRVPGGFQSAGMERFPWFSHANNGKDYSMFKIWFMLASEFHSKSASGELSDLLCAAVVICSNDFCLIFSEGQRAPSFWPRGNGSPATVRSFPKHTADPAGQQVSVILSIRKRGSHRYLFILCCSGPAVVLCNFVPLC